MKNLREKSTLVILLICLICLRLTSFAIRSTTVDLYGSVKPRIDGHSTKMYEYALSILPAYYVMRPDDKIQNYNMMDDIP